MKALKIIIVALTMLLLFRLFVNTGYWWYQLQNILLLLGNGYLIYDIIKSDE